MLLFTGCLQIWDVAPNISEHEPIFSSFCHSSYWDGGVRSCRIKIDKYRNKNSFWLIVGSGERLCWSISIQSATMWTSILGTPCTSKGDEPTARVGERTSKDSCGSRASAGGTSKVCTKRLSAIITKVFNARTNTVLKWYHPPVNPSRKRRRKVVANKLHHDAGWQKAWGEGKKEGHPQVKH